LGGVVQFVCRISQPDHGRVIILRRAPAVLVHLSQKELKTGVALGRGVPQDETQGTEWTRKAADQGHAGAQALLAAMYATGQGVPQDYTVAASWFQKAANQGNADAQSVLGDLYYKGQGVAQDYAAAMSWYRKAADQGNADAQHGLASLYYKGDGVAQDYAAALKEPLTKETPILRLFSRPCTFWARACQRTMSPRTNGSAWRPREGQKTRKTCEIRWPRR